MIPHTHYLQAESESGLIEALEAAGLAQSVPEQTQTIPEHQALVWTPVTDTVLIVALVTAYGWPAEERVHEGVSYFGTGSGWNTLSFVTVPEQTITTPAHLWLAEGVHLVKVGIISKRVGGTDEEPIIETLPGWHANLHLDERYGRDLSDEQKAALPIIAAPKNPVSVLA